MDIELLNEITFYGHLFLLFVCFMIVFFHSVLGGNSDKYHNLCKKTFIDDDISVYALPWLFILVFAVVGTACAAGGVIPYLICGITTAILTVMFGGLVLLAKYISKRIDK